jgi:succinyl-diaminopimelate desuccinylase
VTLPTLRDQPNPLEQARSDQQSVIRLARRLIRIPSRAGIDPYEPILAELEAWLRRRRVQPQLLVDDGRPVGLVCDVVGDQPGPHLVLDACVDTAPFGDETAWAHSPTSGAVADGWLHGRGSADCKTAAAIFCHLIARLARQRRHLHGTVTLLLDVDEHTGGFRGIKRYLAETPAAITGVMIGYPGLEHVVIGGRGFWRADIIVHGTPGHTGRGRDRPDQVNAAEKAAQLVGMLAQHRRPGPVDQTIGLPPRLTVTAIHGGMGYSIIPDRCEVSVDTRLTPTFDRAAAEELVRQLVDEVDRQVPGGRPSEIRARESWPAYRLPEEAPIARALLAAAASYLDPAPTPKVAGPSNIGNYLSSCGIPATAGFGVAYEGLHSTDERIEIATIPAVQAIYQEAVLTLLNGQVASRSPRDW